MATGGLTATIMDDAALHRLMTWMSPSYPVGAYSYSHGLEWAVEAGDVTDRMTLQGWIADILANGSGRNDAIVFLHAHRAATAGDGAALTQVAELAVAFAPSAERHLETTAQGRAFVVATQAAWPCAALDLLSQAWNGPIAYPVAVGVTTAGHGIDPVPALHAYLHGLAANLVSAGVRLVPLGQTAGQLVIAALEAVIHAVCTDVAKTTLDDLGGAAIRADIAAMNHEIQKTRLFRS